MTIEQQIKSFEKYIDAIVAPEYPEIEHFEIEPAKHKVWDLRGNWLPVIEITFYVDGTEEDFERDIRKNMEDMKNLFSLPDIDPSDKIFVYWRFIVDSEWNEKWYK
jgi:hypothetical protein